MSNVLTVSAGTEKATLQGARGMHTLGDAAAEFLRHPSPRVFLLLTAVAWTARLWLGAWSVADVVILATLLLWWPFQEWLIHVFILHMKPRTILGITVDPFVARKHRRHHLDPWNIPTLFVPLRTTVISVPALVLLFHATLPQPLSLTALAGYLALSLNYEWFHYLTHTRYVPRGAIYRHIWRHHRLHHCKNEKNWFGVSMTLADLVLRTAPEPSTVETSETCRTLGYN